MSGQSVRALLYHDVVSSAAALSTSGFSSPGADAYKLDESTFVEHLDAISTWSKTEEGKDASVGHLLDAQSGTGPQIIFTFDDAGASSLRIAELLEQRGWRGHFFAPTRFIGEPTFLDKGGLRDLVNRGHQVGSHSVSHPLRMADLPFEEIRREWRDSLSNLADVLGKEVANASVPGGMYSRRVKRAAEEAGIDVLFTSEPRHRLQRDASMVICGRFSIVRRSTSNEVGAVARGNRSELLRRRMHWDAKKVAKIVIGKRFLALRKIWFNSRSNH